MVIELYTQELLNDIRTKSHQEVAGIEDVEARYRAEAGSEKIEDITRCLGEGLGAVRHRCIRFLKEEITEHSDNLSYLPEKVTFDLALSERRAIGKNEPLTRAMHSLVVEYALSKFYSDVSQMELSNKHSALAINAGNEIDDLLYTKLPPR
jgi:hypothetical protein